MAHVIILAGGKGTRMKSELPKVLHQVHGIPIIQHLLENIESFCSRPTIVVGYGADDVKAATENKYDYALQAEQLGTGHAIMCAKPNLINTDHSEIVVLPGDHPLVTAQTLNDLLDLHTKTGATVTMATAIAPTFEGEHALFLNYGRVIRGADGTVDRIVEYKDASEEERACKEVNLSYYCFDAQWLWENIETLANANAAQEYYLTDMIKLAKNQGRIVSAYPISTLEESLGINTPDQLKIVETSLA
jgi:bifunctional UDP-N-acetylglucosamine pyrophosphorylase / glucosamine-1-phosphate N-acetyltransferase